MDNYYNYTLGIGIIKCPDHSLKIMNICTFSKCLNRLICPKCISKHDQFHIQSFEYVDEFLEKIDSFLPKEKLKLNFSMIMKYFSIFYLSLIFVVLISFMIYNKTYDKLSLVILIFIILSFYLFTFLVQFRYNILIEKIKGEVRKLFYFQQTKDKKKGLSAGECVWKGEYERELL